MKTIKWVLAASMGMSSFAAHAQAAKSDISITGNMGLFSDYRFRGISQTDK